MALASVYPAPADTLCPCLESPEQKALARSVAEAFHLYNCTDATIAKSLSDPDCAGLAQRLKNQVCRLVKKGKSRAEILDALLRRGQSMVELGQPAGIDLSRAPVTGSAKAPVKVTAYVCARCPFCRIIMPKLIKCVQAGTLKDKVRLGVRMFPIRGHKGSVPGGLAFEAAMEMGRFFEYMDLAYREFDAFSEARLVPWAEKCGMPADRFKTLLKSPDTERKLVQEKKEGLANHVTATPTFFINGRKYVGDMDIETLIDVLEEEYDANQDSLR
jgi:protein-disulfide isomerase